MKQATIFKCFLTDSCEHRHRSRSGEASPFPQGDHAVSYLEMGYSLENIDVMTRATWTEDFQVPNFAIGTAPRP